MLSARFLAPALRISLDLNPGAEHHLKEYTREWESI
jgi:hypothetical protein